MRGVRREVDLEPWPSSSVRTGGGTSPRVLARAMIAERKMHPGPVMRLGEPVGGILVGQAGGTTLTKREAPKQARRGAERGGHGWKVEVVRVSTICQRLPFVVAALYKPNRWQQPGQYLSSLLFRRRKPLQLLARPVADKSAPAIVFVHGLNSSADAAWRSMFDICSQDPELEGYDLSCFDYPSAFFSIPYINKMPRFHELARGLKTELDTKHRERSEIILVGHSLGGLVIRQYIVNELKTGDTSRATRALLFAAPNLGASLAEVARYLPLPDRILHNLSRNSETLSMLNSDWELLSVEEKTMVRHVVGGRDGVVPASSAPPFFGRENVDVLVGFDHHTIITPTSAEDMRYLVLKKLLAAQSAHPVSRQRDQENTLRAGDPLFDIYTLSDENYYVERALDARLQDALKAGAVWLSGPTGTGKTASLTRSALISGWQLRQIILAAHTCDNALDALQAIQVELSDLLGIADPLPEPASEAQILSSIRRILRSLPEGEICAVLIEEIPLKSSDQLARFLASILQLSLNLSADPKLNGRVALAFSSIYAPADAANSSKIHERIQMINLQMWQDTEIKALIDTLCSAVRRSLTTEERKAIALAAKGSPRFVKSLFRKWRNGTDNNLDLTRLLELVAREQV